MKTKNRKNQKNTTSFTKLYICITLGLSLTLALVSTLSETFSEWYSINVYPIIVSVIGRIFSSLPFSVAEIGIVLAILLGITFLVLIGIFAFKAVKNKDKDNCIHKLHKFRLKKTVTALILTLSTILMIFVTNCKVNYNRASFLSEDEVIFRDNDVDKWKVFLTILDEFYVDFPDLENQIKTNNDGVFMLTSDLSTESVNAIKNLSETRPRLDIRYPNPKPAVFSNIMTSAFLLGFFSPFTIEATYNNNAPDNEKALSSIHELSHVAGFMREEEANFIAFLAAKESKNNELMYCAYLDVFNVLSLDMTDEIIETLPDNFKEMLVKFGGENTLEKGVAFSSTAILPEQVKTDINNTNKFWRDVQYKTTYVLDENNNVIDTIIKPNQAVEAISNASLAVNDTYLKSQGQGDGIKSYDKMIDLIVTMYLKKIEEGT